ncbi:butyrophilin subfamily 3 member A2-like [Trematomus bernacchii]|uniref:butyrophilin subfamily 3 member A2-like n=1 Tax=Trematomus bernacchii TaxID=40690 RepID=UPI00146C908A|nr:butyrophilin subfamily 3 member A2-like [Trematomus bernacchii]
MGQTQLIGSPQPIVANLGDDIILPCYLEPAINVADLTLEWTRPDMDPRFVHVMRLGHELVEMKHKLFTGRTSMFTDELKNGNMSLKLSNVQLSDQGKYRCFIPKLDRQAFVQLVFGPSSPPVIRLSGLDGQSGGVVLQCESAGWYPEPEVLWLDAEGKLLSAGPPETVRGPDDLYTVSSRVTVEKRPSSSFTCRVQHHNTNRTTQTLFHVPDDFFIVPSSCSASVAVSVLFGFMFVIAAVLFVWKWRQHKVEKKRNHLDEVDIGEKKKLSKTRGQFVTEEEGGQLMTADTVPMEDLKGKEEKKNKQLERNETAQAKSSSSSSLKWPLVSRQKFEEEHQRREGAEKEVHVLEEKLLQNNRETNEQLKEAQGQLESKEKEAEALILHYCFSSAPPQCNEKLRDMMTSKEKELKDLKEEMESKFEKKLQEEKRGREEAERELKEEEEEMKKEMKEGMETKRRELSDQKAVDQWRFENQLKETQSLLDIQRKENSREKTKYNELLVEKSRGEEALKDLKREMESKADELLANVEKLKKEKQRSEDELKKELETKTTEFEKKLQEEKRGREEAERELKEEVQTVQESFSSENQTSDSGFNMESN